MKLKINASNLVTRYFLTVTERGIEFCETSAFGSTQKFRFDQVEAVLRGEGKLIFQVGGICYRIPVQESNALHRATAARLVSEARRTMRKQ